MGRLGRLVVRDHDVHHGVQAVVDAVQALGLLFLRLEVVLGSFRSSKSPALEVSFVQSMDETTT